MKTPTNIGGNNLATFLQTATEIRMADLYTITLKSGTVLRFTTWDSAVIFGNLIIFSEQFDNAAWGLFTTGTATTPAVTPNAVAAPDGSLTADKIVFPATPAASTSRIGQDVQIPGGISSPTFVAGSLWIRGDVPSSQIVLNMKRGTVLGGGGIPGASGIVPNITTQWQRFSGVGDASLVNNPGATDVSMFLTQNASLPALTLYVWGAQITQSSSPAAYVPTVSAPIAGGTFLTGPPHIERTAIEEKTGLDVSTIEVTIKANLTDVISGSPILQAIGQGLWDGAAFRIDRLFMDASGNQIGTLIRFSGVVGPVDELTRSYVKFTANAGTQYLTMQLPPVLMQPNCTHTLFDAGCTLNKASFAENNAVQGGSTVNKIISLSAKADGYYDNGQILFTSGPKNGLLKAVKQYLGQNFFFNSPLPFLPNAGDAFTAYPGDDKTQATCKNKFSNLANFGGFPYVPVPETAI